jgi:hypothetical protein
MAWRGPLEVFASRLASGEFFRGCRLGCHLLKNLSGLGLGLPMKIATEGSSCQEHRVYDAEWQVRCHEEQREENPVNACHVHYAFVYFGGCLGRSGCNDDTTACGCVQMCAAATARHWSSAPCCSIAFVGAVIIRTAAIPISAIKVRIATIKSEATSISEAASKSVAASESPVEPESTTVETTSVDSTAAETTSMEPSAAETTSMTSAAKAAAAARECFVVRGHQSSDDKRGNERRRDFGSHNAFSVFP